MTTWSIGEAAAKCGLSQHTLRWYERIGLLAKIERGGDGRRRFSEHGQPAGVPAKVTVTRWKPSDVSMPSSIPTVFFCASVSSGLCRAAVWIFC